MLGGTASKPRSVCSTPQETFRPIVISSATSKMVTMEKKAGVVAAIENIFNMRMLYVERWRNHRMSLIHEMEVFLAMRKNCRRKEILRHFNEEYQAPRQENCCDNCTSALLLTKYDSVEIEEDDKVDFTRDSRLLLRSVGECKGYYGLGMSVAVLRGTREKRMREYLTTLDIFGKGKQKSKQFWMALGRALCSEGLIGQKLMPSSSRYGRSYSTVFLSDKGKHLLDSADEEVKLAPTKHLQARRNLVEPLTIVSAASRFQNEPDPERDELYCQLMELRNSIASAHNLAPYMIFSEELLLQLAVKEKALKICRIDINPASTLAGGSTNVFAHYEFYGYRTGQS